MAWLETPDDMAAIKDLLDAGSGSLGGARPMVEGRDGSPGDYLEIAETLAELVRARVTTCVSWGAGLLSRSRFTTRTITCETMASCGTALQAGACPRYST